ncbi:MAG: bile acid:sodium symporter family protein [Succinivibrio sp.]|nr:bile acid:sodium symporter family protein [Succinivibrio sp.]
MNPIYIVLPIITLLTYALGLTLRLEDFRLLVKRPLPMLVGLTGQLILLPALALSLAVLFRLPEVFFVGLILIALCPGGSSSNIFTYLARGDVALSVAMTAVSSIVTIFTIPLVMQLALYYLSSQGGTLGNFAAIHLPVGNLLVQNVLLMLLPVLLGVLTRVLLPHFAQQFSVLLSKVAFPSLIILVSIFFCKHYAHIAEHLDRLGLCVLTLVVCSIVLSSLLSRLFKQSGKVRRTIVIEVAMQNAAQAIGIASSPFVFNSEIMTIPAILYALMMNLSLLCYVAMCQRGCRREVAA